jgi:hypothetical protein
LVISKLLRAQQEIFLDLPLYLQSAAWTE